MDSGIVITRKIHVNEEFFIKDFSPCCESWRRQFGDQVKPVANGTGIVPASVFIGQVRIGVMAYAQITEPFSNCPFCGASLNIKNIDAPFPDLLKPKQEIIETPGRAEIFVTGKT